MKEFPSNQSPLLSILGALMVFAGMSIHPLAAQPPAIPTQEPNTPPSGGGPQGRPGGGGRLTDDERQILDAARQKALSDPELSALQRQSESLNQEFRMKMHQAMVKADPRTEELLKKRESQGDRKPGEFGDKAREALQDMSPEQKQKMKAVMEQVKGDASVQAAREKLKNSQNPQEKMAAVEELRAAMKAAVSKVDPSLVDKIPMMMQHGKKDRKGPRAPERSATPQPPMTDAI